MTVICSKFLFLTIRHTSLMYIQQHFHPDPYHCLLVRFLIPRLPLSLFVGTVPYSQTSSITVCWYGSLFPDFLYHCLLVRFLIPRFPLSLFVGTVPYSQTPITVCWYGSLFPDPYYCLLVRFLIPRFPPSITSNLSCTRS